jgi:tetratricopeptide (TPR) repeat protein
MSQLRVFLSHSSKDKAAADQLARAFRQAGADVWYDEESLGAGHLRRTIMKELGDRPIFVVLLSHAALESSWVLDECEWAYDLQRDDPSRVMLPVVLEQLEKSDLNTALYLRSLKRVEAGDLRPLPIGEAATHALRLLGMTPVGQVAAPAAPQPSESAADLVLRGKGLTAQKQYAAATPLFERATRLEPDNWEAWANLGYAQVTASRWQEGLVACERALTLKPKDSVTWNNKASALSNLGRHQEALAAAERAATLQPDYAAAWVNKASALSNLGRHQEALAAAERAATLQPDNARAWNNKGNALNQLGRYEEALVAAERGVAADARNEFPWGTKGRALEMLKRYEEALAAYDRALSLRSNYPYALNGKARVLRALGREAEAQMAERRAKESGG